MVEAAIEALAEIIAAKHGSPEEVARMAQIIREGVKESPTDWDTERQAKFMITFDQALGQRAKREQPDPNQHPLFLGQGRRQPVLPESNVPLPFQQR